MKVLFRIGADWQKRFGIGDVSALIHASILKSKEEDYDSCFEWPLKITYNDDYKLGKYVRCPKTNILPIEFITRDKVNLRDYDKIIDFCEDDYLYKGCRSIYENKKKYPPGASCHADFYGYPNRYLDNTGKSPVLNIPKDNVEFPYILFHFRNIQNYGIEKNYTPKTFLNILNLIKEEVGNRYQLWKCGEPQRILDKKFDYISPHQAEDDFGKFFKMVNNSSLMVGGKSGPLMYAMMFGTPYIKMDMMKLRDNGEYPSDTNKGWKSVGGYGENFFSWIDKNTRLDLWRNEDLDTQKIREFIKRWI